MGKPTHRGSIFNVLADGSWDLVDDKDDVSQGGQTCEILGVRRANEFEIENGRGEGIGTGAHKSRRRKKKSSKDKEKLSNSQLTAISGGQLRAESDAEGTCALPESTSFGNRAPTCTLVHRTSGRINGTAVEVGISDVGGVREDHQTRYGGIPHSKNNTECTRHSEFNGATNPHASQFEIEDEADESRRRFKERHMSRADSGATSWKSAAALEIPHQNGSPSRNPNRNPDRNPDSNGLWMETINGSSPPQASESFRTPIIQWPSMDDVNRYQTPRGRDRPFPHRYPSAFSPVVAGQLWQRNHSSTENVEAAKTRVETTLVGHLLEEVWGPGREAGVGAAGAVEDLKREVVYNTMFHVPWRCELLIEVGFLVCLDSFLTLFTVLPLRLLRRVYMRCTRIQPRVEPQELCDLAHLLVLLCGVALLQQADMSLVYHWIRGQAVIKLYVVFNVLEVGDKLCQSFGADVLQVVYNAAERVTSCPSGRVGREGLHLMLDQGVALAAFMLHSMIIMAQAVTLNVAINSHSTSLLTLLVSNNFTEVKSNVFKRLVKDNVHKMAYLDTVERFHIFVHLLFVLVHNLVKGEASLSAFAMSAGTVLLCEVSVDLIKHAFLAKFNDIKPSVYSEFLQSLCRQTLESRSANVHRTLTFVPLAPACLVVRALVPLFVSLLPIGSPQWRVTVGFFFGVVLFVLLTLLKAILGISLQLHARWYLNRCLLKEAKEKAEADNHPHNA